MEQIINFDNNGVQYNITVVNGHIGDRGRGERLGNSIVVVDMNHDDIDDLVIAASAYQGGYINDSAGGGRPIGNVYVIYGVITGFSNYIDLSFLDGTTGFKILGPVDPYSCDLGDIIASGDYNGDGYKDILLGCGTAYELPPKGYVVFSSNRPFNSTLSPADLDGTNGFEIVKGTDAPNSPAYSGPGARVFSAGDVNGDGYDDIIWNHYQSSSHAVYVIYGKSMVYPSVFDVDYLTSQTGFIINSGGTSDVVISGGDINNDLFDDIAIISFPLNRISIVYGKGEFSSSIDLGNLDANGMTLTGVSTASWGIDASLDINNDQVKDLMVSANEKAYLIFGNNNIFQSTIDLSNFIGITMYSSNGVEHVFALPDSNGDSINEIGITLYNGDRSGYIVYGKQWNSSTTIDLDNLDVSQGYRVKYNDGTYFSSIAAGDFNNDGVADIAFGAPIKSTNGITGSGQASIIWGTGATTKPTRIPTQAPTGTPTDIADNKFCYPKITPQIKNIDNINGTNHCDFIKGNGNDNVIYSLGGNDKIVGSRGNDYLDGGNGIDTVSYENSTVSVYVNMKNCTVTKGNEKDQIFNFEIVIGSNHSDTFTLSNQTLAVRGGEGDDNFIISEGVEVKEMFIDGGEGSNGINFENYPRGISMDLTSGEVYHNDYEA